MMFTESLVEFVDILPTLVEAAGLPQLDLCPEFSRNVSLCRQLSLLSPHIPKLRMCVQGGHERGAAGRGRGVEGGHLLAAAAWLLDTQDQELPR